MGSVGTMSAIQVDLTLTQARKIVKVLARSAGDKDMDAARKEIENWIDVAVAERERRRERDNVSARSQQK